MVMFLALHRMEFIRFAGASIHVADFNCLLQNFLNKAIGIINFVNLFLNVITDTKI